MAAEELTPQQEQAILALVSTDTLAKAAKKAGVAESTLWDWKQRPAFARAYRRARRQLVDAQMTELIKLGKAAVAALKRNLKCKNPAVEVRAAIGILDKIIQGQALADLTAEAEELREQVETAGAHGGPSPSGDPSSESGGVEPSRPHDELGELDPTPGTGGIPSEPGPGLPESGDDTGPVAGESGGGHIPPADDVVLPPIGEDDDGGDSDAPPLFVS